MFIWLTSFVAFIVRVFHMLPDDTGKSAIWVAQRVPDDHISAVTNQFVIGDLPYESKNHDFMISHNLFGVALRNGLWSPPEPLNFARVYGKGIGRNSYMSTRRIWRIFTLAAPSLQQNFSAYTDEFGTFGYGAKGNESYPFSVKPDKKLTVQDIMNINRDQYEGTPFDMTKGVGKCFTSVPEKMLLKHGMHCLRSCTNEFSCPKLIVSLVIAFVLSCICSFSVHTVRVN